MALAAGIASIAIAGCGSGDEMHIKPIQAPEGTVDLGNNSIPGAGFLGGSAPGRSLLAPSDEAKEVYCGGIEFIQGYLIGGGHDEPQEMDFYKQIKPASGGMVEVDCLYDDWFADFSEIEQAMTVRDLPSQPSA